MNAGSRIEIVLVDGLSWESEIFSALDQSTTPVESFSDQKRRSWSSFIDCFLLAIAEVDLTFFLGHITRRNDPDQVIANSAGDDTTSHPAMI